MITTPRNFVVETDTEYAEDWNSRVFYLRWSSAETMVDNYTIVWCRGSKWRRNCDPDDEVHYEILPGTASEYKLKIPPGDVGRKPDDYMIGIASEVRQASSGIIWAPCFHIKDVDPPEVRDITASPVKNNVDVAWLHRGCNFDYNDSRAYISNYSITYCRTVSGSTCSGSEHKEVVDQFTARHTLKNLKPGTKYLIQVTAFSQHGQGPPGKVEVEIPAIQDDTSTNDHLIPIILALIVVTILVSGLIYLKRRCTEKAKKFVVIFPPTSL
ncbi:uncharacterized protein LOC112574263 [Pomacea canaliculata]|uniref:uncharacterized protein LOC112574263 n=1 Tax=Pomacea canaliculata TaxID=400727 RepID=UPI000D730125|nr:uncharacterized protein LOC112574263 [Pomacea canaliculata]